MADPRKIERVPAGVEFEFKLVYNVEDIDEVDDDIKILADGLSLLQMDYLGGHGSRGYGRVSFSDFKIKNINVDREDCDEYAQYLESGCSL